MASVAAKEAIAHPLRLPFVHRFFRFDREIGQASRRIQAEVPLECTRRTGLDTLPTGCALGRHGLGWSELQVRGREDFGQVDIGAVARDDEHIVFANEEEAKAYTGKEGEAALHQLAEGTEVAILKLGKDGSMIKRANEVVKVGIIPAKSVDTTGAGDLYAAGFLFGLIQLLHSLKHLYRFENSFITNAEFFPILRYFDHWRPLMPLNF